MYHWEDKSINYRERASSQTFPDDFIFTDSKEKFRQHVGMTVPPEQVVRL
ncbi:DNA cytosine methyltransferase [Brevibacillus formosus]|nr:DNA cytosine methyltransferase [Brevibacillus formosus]MED1958261.1 DNA cytosine methyltransferase [Brevibacillus formosus]